MRGGCVHLRYQLHEGTLEVKRHGFRPFLLQCCSRWSGYLSTRLTTFYLNFRLLLEEIERGLGVVSGLLLTYARREGSGTRYLQKV